MITIFSIPKPFKDHISVIQHNAIRSWTELKPRCEVLLFGRDEGTAEAAAQYGARHIPDVACNDHGTPLLSDMFARAQQLAAHDIVCYVNGDIMFTDDLIKSVEKVAAAQERFLILGRRWNVDITERLDFSSGWEAEVRELVRQKGELYAPDGIDYFIFRRGMIRNIPEFAVGRPAWDNWMVFYARSIGAAVVDSTAAITCVHQNHNYNHLKNISNRFGNGPEAQKNFELCGGWKNFYTIYDANYVLDEKGLHRAYSYTLKQPKLKLKRVLLSLKP